MLPETLRFENDILYILDQRRLPGTVEYIPCTSAEETARAIDSLAVRGAPAIGIAAAYGVALASRSGRSAAEAACERLARTRPTAVNLFWALDRMKRKLPLLPDNDLYPALLEEARSIHREDRENNRLLGEAGAALLPPSCTVLTHCNAGALATGGHGTALGVIRSAREAGKTVKVFATETRPVLQGARLTVWELLEDGFDVTLICDSMAGALLKTGTIDGVITGADRVAANGDAANKIGTLSLAVLAAHFNVPFYIAAPLSTIDRTLSCGASIPIEERDTMEMRLLPGGGTLPERYTLWNPAFDVTDASLIAAIITEKGVARPPYGESLRALFHEKGELP